MGFVFGKLKVWTEKEKVNKKRLPKVPTQPPKSYIDSASGQWPRIEGNHFLFQDNLVFQF